MLTVISLVFILTSLVGSAGCGCAAGVSQEIPVKQLSTILEENVLPAYPTLLAGVEVEYLKEVTTGSLNDDVKTVVDNMVFPSSTEVYTYARILQIPGATEDTVTEFKASAEAYVRAFLTPETDTLYSITWFLKNGETVNTVAVGQLKDGIFTAKYEPFADAIVTVTTSPETSPGAAAEAQATSSGQIADWRSIIGITLVSAVIEISGTSADGCTLQGIITSFVASAGFPYVIEPSSAAPSYTIWCSPKENCCCLEKFKDKMECATATQSYSVILRIGISPVAIDVATSSDTVSAWISADGHSGAGRGY